MSLELAEKELDTAVSAGEEDVRLNYTIVDVKCPLFYDMLLNEQEQTLLRAVGFVADGTMIPGLAEQFDAEYARHAPDTLGDRWLICSDGLTNMVPDETLLSVLKEAETDETAADELLALALEKGGTDNISFVLCRVTEVSGV